MIVITLTDCPPALRGDLTKWLQEINTGVYVGRVSARVREKIWERVQDSSKTGRATMVFSTNNEQRMDFRVHNTVWEPIDFDGLKLIMRPSPARIKKLGEQRLGFSNASKHHKAKLFAGKGHGIKLPNTYVIADITSKSEIAGGGEIYRIDAIAIEGGQLTREHHSILRLHAADEIGEQQTKGNSSDDSILEFLQFVDTQPIVSHGAHANQQILRRACRQANLPLFSNRYHDTATLSQRLVEDASDYKLETLLELFKVDLGDPDPSISVCLAVKAVFEKLIKIQENSFQDP